MPPAVPELGTSSGFDFQLQDIGGVGHDTRTAKAGWLRALFERHGNQELYERVIRLLQ